MQTVFYDITKSEKYVSYDDSNGNCYDDGKSVIVYAVINDIWDGIGPWRS